VVGYIIKEEQEETLFFDEREETENVCGLFLSSFFFQNPKL